MIKRNHILVSLLIVSSAFCFSQSELKKQTEKTVFQTSQPWRPTIDNRGDVAIIYGVGGNPSDSKRRPPFEERVQSWQRHGYITHFMTGIAWGEYKDYFTGEWDGKSHLDEGQVQQNGDTIWHGHLVPYIVPTKNYLKYIKEKHIKRVIDAGINTIYLEEPEFWARAGYSEAFKREWKDFYHFDWRPQHESPENTYLANKLKYHLYYRALQDIFTYAKAYGKSKGMDIKCYVPTHSLINYSQWMIVSPEASLASMPCIDGYIAQIWTGTSREPNFYNGIAKERVFETAFLEYGSMESMTAPTGRKIFFLTDPIEDRAQDWVDYKKNYEATFTAQLLYPNIANYEIMPWPERIYEGLYRKSKNSQERIRIPQHYSTQMQIMINALNDMPSTSNTVSGSSGISVLLANSLMFQRFPTHNSYQDPQLSNFYGQALPFVKRGVPIKTVHIENLSFDATLKDTKILLMTYSNMKPLSPDAHKYLSEWVKNGGIIVYSARDNDPYQTVQEWWNTNTHHYAGPSAHLFELMNMPLNPKEGLYVFGKGKVYVSRHDPKEYVLSQEADTDFVQTVKQLYGSKNKKNQLLFKNNFFLQRGNYELISVINESVTNEAYHANGLYIDLFDPTLPVIHTKIVEPGSQAFLYNVARIKNKNQPRILASAARIYDEKIRSNSFSFVAKSPLNTSNTMRILLPSKPTVCTINDHEGNEIKTATYEWNTESKTCRLVFDNQPEGITVSLKF